MLLHLAKCLQLGWSILLLLMTIPKSESKACLIFPSGQKRGQVCSVKNHGQSSIEAQSIGD